MRVIYGMAKTNFSYQGGSGRSLRLDLLELINAVKELKLHGKDSHGYLLVVKDEIVNWVNGWRTTYGGEDHVTIVKVNLTPAEQIELQNLNKDNSDRQKEGGLTPELWTHTLLISLLRRIT